MQCILLQTYPHSITDIGNWVNFNEKKIEKKKLTIRIHNINIKAVHVKFVFVRNAERLHLIRLMLFCSGSIPFRKWNFLRKPVTHAYNTQLQYAFP